MGAAMHTAVALAKRTVIRTRQHTGVAVSDVSLATSSSRHDNSWQMLPAPLRAAFQAALERNPCRSMLAHWDEECAGDADYPALRRILEFGAPRVRARLQTALAAAPSASAPEHADRMHAIIQGEVDDGVLLRFPPEQLPLLRAHGFLDHVHPLGAVPKFERVQFVDTRPIHEYSYPAGKSVNHHIDYLSVRQDRTDDALAFLHAHPGCFMAKIDIKSFFRVVPLHPADFRLTVFRYDFGEGRGLEPVVDTRVPFGMRHAPEICCRFSRCILRALRRRLQARGVELSTQAGAEVHNVVDDWLTLAVCAAQGGCKVSSSTECCSQLSVRSLEGRRCLYSQTLCLTPLTWQIRPQARPCSVHG